MGLYRKKPVVVEAWQVTRENADQIARMCGGRVVRESKPGDSSDVYVALEVPTLEGVMRAETVHPSTWDGHRYLGGDWIIRGIRGEFYPCKPDIFEATYEAVDGEGDSDE